MTINVPFDLIAIPKFQVQEPVAVVVPEYVCVDVVEKGETKAAVSIITQCCAAQLSIVHPFKSHCSFDKPSISFLKDNF